MKFYFRLHAHFITYSDMIRLIRINCLQVTTSYAFNQQTRNKFLLWNEIYVMAKIYTVKKGKLDLSFYFTMIAALENPPDL
jgi:hypothetical protein